ncbi:MAG: hypothetical protein NHB32_14350 [Fischerella sp. CENA71]|nr:hypothetical protein [Fischerella sp. CENA71]
MQSERASFLTEMSNAGISFQVRRRSWGEKVGLVRDDDISLTTTGCQKRDRPYLFKKLRTGCD